MTTIICSRCKSLVDVVDRQIALHDHPATGERCPLAGSRYVPQKPNPSGTGRPSLRVESVTRGTFTCEHGHTFPTLDVKVSVSGGNPNWN